MMMPYYRKVSDSLFVANSDIVALGQNDFDLVKSASESTDKKRSRINAHVSDQDLLHEMFLCIQESSYIRPHKHNFKSESYFVIDGKCDVVIFKDCGEIDDVIRLDSSKKYFSVYCRISKCCYHTLVVRSDFLVMHEVTNGPFDKSDTFYASFAPSEDDAESVTLFRIKLINAIDQFVLGK